MSKLCPALVPASEYRNKWLGVILCAECDMVRSVIDAHNLPDNAGVRWTAKAGWNCGPCPSCGYFVAATAKGGIPTYEGDQGFLFATARYVDPFVLWRPSTWFRSAGWEIHWRWEFKATGVSADRDKVIVFAKPKEVE